MLTIDLTTLHTLLVLAREATHRREQLGDGAAVPDIADCHDAIATAADAIERAFEPGREARAERALSRCYSALRALRRGRQHHDMPSDVVALEAELRALLGLPEARRAAAD